MYSTFSNSNHVKTWNPLQELLNDFWDVPFENQASTRTWQPACDVVEDQDHYLLVLEMAGIPKDQIKIDVIDNQLVVSGEWNKENGVIYSERRYGKFHRSFTLPTGLQMDKIEANYQDGILRILIPKMESAKPRQIKIGTGAGTSFFGKLIGQNSHSNAEKLVAS